MADPARARKLADRIKVVVAETLERRVKDPRLGFITVTDARVTNDLQHATVFYTVFGDDTEKASTAAALESARGVVRAEVGRRTGTRLTPTLEFIADAVPENAAAIDDLLREAANRDAQVAELAKTAEYAGDPDPYRTPGDEGYEDDPLLADDFDDDDEDDADSEDSPGSPDSADSPDER